MVGASTRRGTTVVQWELDGRGSSIHVTQRLRATHHTAGMVENGRHSPLAGDSVTAAASGSQLHTWTALSGTRRGDLEEI